MNDYLKRIARRRSIVPERLDFFCRRMAVGLSAMEIWLISKREIRAAAVLDYEEGLGELTDLELKRIDGMIRAREARKE